MNKELWHLMVNQNITLVTLWVVFFALGVVLIYWLYAEVIIYKRRKIVEIEKVRNKMDGIELGIRRHSKGSGRNSLVIDLSTLDRSPAAIRAATGKLAVTSNINTPSTTSPAPLPVARPPIATPITRYTPAINNNIIEEEEEEYYAEIEDNYSQRQMMTTVADIESSGDSGEHTQDDDEEQRTTANEEEEDEDDDSEIDVLAETVMLRHPRY